MSHAPILPSTLLRPAIAAALLALAASAQAAGPAWLPPVSNTAKPATPGVRAAATAVVSNGTTTTTARAAQTLVVDDDAHGAWQEAINPSCGPYAGACQGNFSTVAAGHRRVVTHVSCIIVGYPGSRLRSVSLLDTNYSLPRDFYPYTAMPVYSADDYPAFIINSPTNLVFEAGTTPQIISYIDNQRTSDLICTVSGRDITL